MELPFKSDVAEFESEFKTALGFVDADIPYNKIKPDLLLSANEVVKVIGLPTYEELIKNYKLNSEGDSGATAPYRNENLNSLFQHVIACFGYKSFAPSNDLAHTADGRKMRSSENSKTPFEWMVAKDDDNLTRRSYKALDALIVYMDLNFQFWKDAEQFKVTHELFVRTTDDFSDAYVIDSRLLLIKLVPGLKRCEQREILPRLGAEYYAILKDKVLYNARGADDNDDLLYTENDKKILSFIKEACAYYALSWGLPRLQLQIFPEGILQAVRSDRQTIKGRKVPEVPVIDQASQLFARDAEIAFSAIEDIVKAMFPEEENEVSDSPSDDYSQGDYTDKFFDS